MGIKKLFLYILILFLFLTTLSLKFPVVSLQSARAAVLIKAPNNLGLVGYWSMNEGTGTQVGDSSGNGYAGTITGATWTSGKHGKALSFNGTPGCTSSCSDYGVVTTGNISLPTSLSVCAWIYPTRSEIREIILHGSSPVTAFEFFQSGLALYLRGGSLTAVNTGNVLSLNKWNFICGTISSTTGTIYYNGSFSTSGAVTAPNTGPAHLNIGAYENNNYAFNGLIDDVRIYNRALSASQVAALYQSGAVKINSSQNSKSTSDLVGLWSFNGADISGATAYDRSGQGRNATVTGATKTIGKIGQALSFSGSGQYSQASGFAELGTSNQPYTFAGWVKADAGETDGNIIHMSSLVGGTGWCLPPVALVSGKLRGYSRNGGGVSVTGTSTLSSGIWYHFANTWDAVNGLRIFVNGSLENSTAQATYSASGASNYVWLSYSPGSCAGNNGDFDGSIDEVRIYNRALTASEVAALYQSGTVKIKDSLPQLLGLSLWLKADAIKGLNDGDAIASWLDSSGNGYNVTQSTAAYKPLYKTNIQNGRPTVRFDGSDDMLGLNTFVGSSQFTIFSVQRFDALTGWPTVYATYPYNFWGFVYYGTNVFFGFTGADPPPQYESDYYPAHITSTTVPELWTARYDQVYWRAWVNGGALATMAETRTPYTAQYISVGGWDWIGFRPFDGDIFEIVVYNRALSDAERQRVESYLKRKWGL